MSATVTAEQVEARVIEALVDLRRRRRPRQPRRHLGAARGRLARSRRARPGRRGRVRRRDQVEDMQHLLTVGHVVDMVVERAA